MADFMGLLESLADTCMEVCELGPGHAWALAGCVQTPRSRRVPSRVSVCTVDVRRAEAEGHEAPGARRTKKRTKKAADSMG